MPRVPVADTLPGALTLDTLPALLGRSTALCSAGTLDLSGVTRADSAGLAFLLWLQRQATAEGRPLCFAGAPAQLRGLADFLGLRSLLSLDTTDV